LRKVERNPFREAAFVAKKEQKTNKYFFDFKILKFELLRKQERKSAL
jgi:hypothetical protein